MDKLDLQEFDRLEKRVRAVPADPINPFGRLCLISPDKLRPLLTLVSDLGDKLEDAATALHVERVHEGRFWDCQRLGCSSASDTVREYRRAKGEWA